MSIVERFITVDSWPTGRKTVLVMAVALVAHLSDWLAVHLLVADNPAFDPAVIDLLMAAGTAAFAACLVAGALAERSGGSGAWTAYLFVALGGTFFAAMPYVFGSWSSPLVAVLPVTVMLTALWYGRSVALVLLVHYVALTTVVGLLQSSGRLPYAPALEQRDAGLFISGTWVVATMVPVGLVFAVALPLSLLVMQARGLQESRLTQAQDQLQRSNWMISRYVPAQVARRITAGEQAATSYERRRLTVFFSDLVGFTDAAEELEPEDLSRVLNEYFCEMTAIADRHGGTVDELQGDALLILFGAPEATDDKDHAVRAVRMAMEMQQSLQALNERWRRAGICEPVSARMGINTGVVTVGDFGSPQRMKYAALGKHVNVAARLQTHCPPGGVLLSQATWLLVQDTVPCVPQGAVQLKGIVKAVPTYCPETSPARSSAP